MMNKGLLQTVLSAVLAALVILVSLGGCVERPSEDQSGDWNGKDEFEPSDGMGKDTEALAERYEEYKENAGLAFKQNQPAAGSDFTVSDFQGGVKIDGYTGSDNVIVIPESIDGKAVVAIGAKAFSSAAIRAVYVPDSVTFIEKGAFEGADAITTLRLPFVGDGKEVTHFGHIFGSDGYSNHAVKVPTSLDMVILGEGVTEIDGNAFAGCKTISAVVLPVNIEMIGDFAFYECKDLVYVSRNTAVKEIGSYAFGYCSSLYKAEFVLAESLGLGALYECNSLRFLSLPFVGGSATENRFLGYIFGAESADYNDEFVPQSLFSVSVSALQCRDIPDRAFSGCAYISEVIFDTEIESIGIRSFYACRSLKSITLPDAVKTIGDDAFFGCDNLEEVDLGEGVESIGMQAFYGCRKLKNVVLPEKVGEIKPSTFAFCSSLKTVELNNVKKVGKDAFYKCVSLTPVDLTGIEVADGNDALKLIENE